jgi:signal transduction histidine kinase
VRKRARSILRASWRMERLLQNVLAFAVARVKGAIPISLADADLSTIAHNYVADLEASVAERVRIEGTGDSKGRWDPERMAQLVSNLVDNAVEHGDPKAPIVISIDGSETDRVLLAIRNGGLIAETELEDLFSPFKRNSQSRRGIGLGLALVSLIARAHGGEISVRSNAAEGTTFELRLPRHPTPPADAPT